MIGILFDLDGTLLDTLQDLTDSTNAALTAFGHPQRTVTEVRRFVGNGALELMRKAVPDGENPELVLAYFQKHYPAHCRIHTAPYAGVTEALEELKGQYPMAIVSNKPDAAVKELCAELFPGIFAIGERPDCRRKPAPDMVHQAMKAIGVERCVYVGDSEVDIATAKNAGVPCLTVTWGFREEAELIAAGAQHMCHSVGTLVKRIRDLTAL